MTKFSDNLFNHIPDDRKLKLQTLIDAGVNPWGGQFDPRIPIADARAKFPEFDGELLVADPHRIFGESIRIAGRICLFRDFGQLAFMTLEDQSGKLQCALAKKILKPDTQEPPRNLLKLWQKTLDLGDIVGVEGDLMFTQKGEPTLWIKELTLLTKAMQPPPGKFHGLQDTETQYRKRYLHLMSDSDARGVFIKRSRIVSAIRSFMDKLGFLEIEGPVLQSIPGGAAARPFMTHHNALDMDLYMRIATELPLKMMLVGGIEKVYEIGRLFRNEGVDSSHNPEFTTIEFYQSYADLRTMINLTERLFETLANDVVGTSVVRFREQDISFKPPFAQADFRELIESKTGVKRDDLDGLRAKLKDKGFSDEAIKKLDADHLLDEVFSEYVEPEIVQPTFVMRQPVSLAPLCKPCSDDTAVSDRFELYVCGMEVANAYSELNDPFLQRDVLSRQAGDIEKGIVEGKIDETFLDALEHGMPPAGGEGIGIDRLVMILTGQYSIRDVILFPLLKR